MIKHPTRTPDYGLFFDSDRRKQIEANFEWLKDLDKRVSTLERQTPEVET